MLFRSEAASTDSINSSDRNADKAAEEESTIMAEEEEEETASPSSMAGRSITPSPTPRIIKNGHRDKSDDEFKGSTSNNGRIFANSNSKNKSLDGDSSTSDTEKPILVTKE